MGDPSEFYTARGSNKKTYLVVEYKSGRVEVLEYKTQKAARKDFERMKTADIAKSVRYK